MKPPIKPDSPDHQAGLQILNLYLNDVLCNERLGQQNKHDAMKVIECLKFIKVNLGKDGFISYAFEHQKDPAIYEWRYKKPLDPRDAGQAVKDQENSVLRDLDGTSFHIDKAYYKNAAAGLEAYTNMIAEFEGAIVLMRAKNHLHPFTLKLEYDGDKGCLPKRIGGALDYANRLNGAQLQLNDLMQSFSHDYPAIAAGEINLSQAITLAINYFKSDLGKFFFWQNELVELNEIILRKYFVDTFFLDESAAPTLNWNSFSEHMTLGQGYYGMVHCKFSDSKIADEFVSWVKRHADIVDIQKAKKAKISFDSKTVYLVRLSQEQHQCLKMRDQVSTGENTSQAINEASGKKEIELPIVNEAEMNLKSRFIKWLAENDVSGRGVLIANLSTKVLASMYITQTSLPPLLERMRTFQELRILIDHHADLSMIALKKMMFYSEKLTSDIDLIYIINYLRDLNTNVLHDFFIAYSDRGTNQSKTEVHLINKAHYELLWLALIERRHALVGFDILEAMSAHVHFMPSEKMTLDGLYAFISTLKQEAEKYNNEPLPLIAVLNTKLWEKVHSTAQIKLLQIIQGQKIDFLIENNLFEVIEYAKMTDDEIATYLFEELPVPYTLELLINDDVFMRLIISSSVSREFFETKYKDNVYNWSKLARFVETVKSETLVDLLTAKTLSSSVNPWNYRGALFEGAMKYLPSETILIALNKMSDTLLRTAIMSNPEAQKLLIQWASWWQPSEVVLNLLKRFDAAGLITENLLLEIGTSLLSQTSDVVVFVIQKLSVNNLLKELKCRFPFNLFSFYSHMFIFRTYLPRLGELENIIFYQAGEVFEVLLDKIDIDKIIELKDLFPKAFTALILRIIEIDERHNVFYQDREKKKVAFTDPDKLNNWCNASLPEIKKNIKQRNIYQNKLTEFLNLCPEKNKIILARQMLDAYFIRNLKFYGVNRPAAYMWMKTVLAHDHDCLAKLQVFESISSHQVNQSVPLDLLWQHGVKSWEQFREMQLNGDDDTKMVLGLLYRMNLQFSGCAQLAFADIFPAGPNSEFELAKKIMKKFRSEGGFVKVIKPQNWKEFYGQISDYAVRPSVRQAIKNPQFKFNHLTGAIFKLPPKTKKTTFLSTRKTPVSFVFPEHGSPLFGVHDPRRPRSALLFDMNLLKEHIKIFLLEDAMTWDHCWISDKEENVLDYRNRIRAINCGTFDEFIAKAKKRRGVHTEILLHLTRESIEAIIIGSHHAEELENSIMRQDELRKLNINVPIIHYDADDGELLYFPRKLIYALVLKNLENILVDFKEAQSWSSVMYRGEHYSSIVKGCLPSLLAFQAISPEQTGWLEHYQKIRDYFDANRMPNKMNGLFYSSTVNQHFTAASEKFGMPPELKKK